MLTACHGTVPDFKYAYTEVIAGRNNLATDTSGFVARVSNAWTHQGYNFEAQINTGAAPVDDLSVLTLKDPLPAAYVPVTLVSQGVDYPAADTDATIVGYGITDSGINDSGILRAAAVKTASDETCAGADQWGALFDPTRMMCAGLPPTTDTCAGDSGGPIFTGAAGSYLQIGMTDWARKDADRS